MWTSDDRRTLLSCLQVYFAQTGLAFSQKFVRTTLLWIGKRRASDRQQEAKRMRDAEAFIRGEQCSNIVGSAKCSEAVADVISQRLPTFYKTAYRLLGNAADAEDAVQDALLSAYKKLHQFRGEAQMSTWLTVIVGNCARMQLRRRRHIHLSLDEPIGQGQDSPLSERLP